MVFTQENGHIMVFPTGFPQFPHGFPPVKPPGAALEGHGAPEQGDLGNFFFRGRRSGRNLGVRRGYKYIYIHTII